MNRRFIGHKGGSQVIEEFDFEMDTNASFLIRRESDNVEQTFTYAEVIDGTYDAFVTGTEGAVKKWFKGTELMQNATGQMRLKSNAGYPYLDDYFQKASLWKSGIGDMAGDWVISVIREDEYYGGNQSLSFAVRGTGANLLGVMFRATNGPECCIVIDRLTSETGVPDYKFIHNQNGLFKLFTFSKIGGIFKVHYNNTEVTLTSSSTLTATQDAYENTATLGNTFPNGGGGKITKWKHFGMNSGDLSGFDLNAYNQSIMTKYGI